MRPISSVEQAVLARLLSMNFDGVEALKRQAESIREVDSNCACGCPSITPQVDRAATPPAHCPSPLPVELAEMHRPDGIPRTVLCFLDSAGYISNLECVYYDDALPEWPAPAQCSVLLRDADRCLEAVRLPSGAVVHPHDPEDRWVSFKEQADGGFCAPTRSGYRECFAGDGSEQTRVFVE